jgi:CCR4-NOT transcriptional complex subunit CAF120
MHPSDAHNHQHNSQPVIPSRSPSNAAPLDRDFAPLPPQNNQQRAQTMGPLRPSSDQQDGPGPDMLSPAARRLSNTAPPLHPEIRSIVQLTLAHARKVYFSGPLIKRVQRQPDGHRPKDDAWIDVWAQLGGTTLSIWDMKEVEEANKEGREVPPTYVNMTDAVSH